MQSLHMRNFAANIFFKVGVHLFPERVSFFGLKTNERKYKGVIWIEKIASKKIPRVHGLHFI